MKTCPYCKSTNVIVFDADNDLCNDCEKWFPAVADESPQSEQEDELWDKMKKIIKDEDSQSYVPIKAWVKIKKMFTISKKQ